MKKQFFVQYDDGQLWLDKDDQTQDLFDWTIPDKYANGFKWGMAVKLPNQRKYHPKSGVAHSVVAMLPDVKRVLMDNSSASVMLLTPDVEIIFRT